MNHCMYMMECYAFIIKNEVFYNLLMRNNNYITIDRKKHQIRGKL